MSTFDKLKRTSGFTLIELLVVIAIIGILSSVVLASLNGARESSRDARRQTDLSQLRTALALYRDQQGNYPADLDELASSSALTQLPTDPSDDSLYGYTTSTAGAGDFCLAAELESTSSMPDDNDTDCQGLTWPNSGNSGDFNYFVSG